MKEITKREEFGKAVNFGEHQVITIDLNQVAFGGVIFKGCKARIDYGKFRTGERYIARGEVNYDINENKVYVANYGVCLSNRFSYDDAMEQIEYAKAPIIDDGDEVVIVIHNSKTNDLRVYLATAKKLDRNCSTMMIFE